MTTQRGSMNAVIVGYHQEFNTAYALEMTCHVMENRSVSLFTITKDAAGNTLQILWADPFLMMNMGAQL